MRREESTVLQKSMALSTPLIESGNVGMAESDILAFLWFEVGGSIKVMGLVSFPGLNRLSLIR